MDKNSLRPIEAAENAVENVKQTARGKLLSWLPRFTCTKCGALCESDVQFVERQADYLPVWECPECESRYHRDDNNPLSANMWD